MDIFKQMNQWSKLGPEKNIGRISLITSLLLLGVSILMIWWFLFPEILDQNVVPLHYNIYSGVDYVGVWWKIFTIPAFLLAAIIVNGILAKISVKKDPILPVLFHIVSMLIAFFLFIANIFVVLLNISYYG